MNNTGRQYDTSLVQRIQKGTRTENIDGLDVELRPIPDDPREHALDPRVDALYQLRKSGAFPTPKISDLISLRVRPDKENHEIDDGGVAERVIPMNLGDRIIHLFAFTPKGHRRGTPVLVYFHGGGFTVGNISQFRAPLRYLAERSGCVVAYPEYRLSPECPFPGPVADCNDAVEWIATHADELGVDPTRMALAGDSAGGSLSNAVTILQRDSNRVKLVVEMYSLVDGGPIPPEWSHDLYPCLPEQEEAAMSRTDRVMVASNGLASTYTQGRTALLYDPLVSAAFYARLDEFPRTVVVGSEFDYLRYQDERFARKLHDVGVNVRCIRYLGCDHGFFETCGVMPQVEDLCNVMAEELAQL